MTGRVALVTGGSGGIGASLCRELAARGADYAASKSRASRPHPFPASRTAVDGVTVNSLAPGFIETAMLTGDAKELAAGVPVGRVGSPEEVADLALASCETAI